MREEARGDPDARAASVHPDVHAGRGGPISGGRRRLTTVDLYGIRIANDLVVDNAAKHDPAFFDELLALELELCDRAPYNRIGFAWQLVLER